MFTAEHLPSAASEGTTVYTQLYLNSSCALAIDSISHHADSFCLYIKFWVRCMCYIGIDLSHVSMLMLH